MMRAATSEPNARIYAILALGLLATSSGAIFARLAEAHPLVIAAYRVGIAAFLLVVFLAVFHRAAVGAITRRQVVWTGLAGICLAVHFATWISSLSFTSIANSVALVNTTPIWIAVAMAIGGRRASRPMVISVGLAFIGATTLVAGGLSLETKGFLGDGLAIAGSLAMAAYLLIGKRVRGGMDLLPYVSLTYGWSALMLWALVVVAGLPVTGFDTLTWQAFLGMAVFSQIVGHSTTNWALKLFPPAFLAVVLLGEPIVASFLGYLIFDEVPTMATWIGAPLVLAGIYIGARASADA